MPEVTRLDTGLTVATDAIPQLGTASVSVIVWAGSRHETPPENGIAHVLEHMAFKGTAHRTAAQIREEIADVGGFINAQTGHEYTGYSTRVLKEYVPLSIELLADVVLNPLLDAAELAKEKQVIEQEIASRRDSPTTFLGESLMEGVYPQQSLGRPIAGTLSTLRSFDRQALIAFRERTYHAPNTFVLAAGAVDHDRLVSDVARHMASFSDHGRVSRPAPGVFHSALILKERKTEQANLAIAVPAPTATDGDYFSALVLCNILGGGMTSRLFYEAREKRALCYSIGCSYSDWWDGALMTIYAATDPQQARACSSRSWVTLFGPSAKA